MSTAIASGHRSSGRPAGRRNRGRVVLWILLAIMVVIYGFPFLYLLLTSFKQATDTVSVPPAVLPKHWTLSNYTSVLRQPGITSAFINSVTIAVLSTVISMALAVPAAYGVTRYASRSGQAFMMGALLTRMVPAIAIGVPLAAMMHTLKLFDSPLGVALAHVTISLPLSIWLMSSFFQAVPVEIDESAQVDGCSRTSSLVRVVLPVVSGGLAVTAIFAFLSSWNEFLFALLLTAVKSQTTPIAIANFQTQYGLELGPMTALACLYSLPVVVLTVLLQKRIVAGLSLGAVKG